MKKTYLILLFIVFICSYKIYTCNKNADKEYGYNIKDWSGFESYINNQAKTDCEFWHKQISSYTNEQNKHEAWVGADNVILSFEAEGIQAAVERNDLPEDFVQKGYEIYNRQMKSCGYYSYGGSPPSN